MPAAATSVPSGEMASAMIGVAEASTSARMSPCGDRKYTLPLAPAATISPSGATATVLSGVGSVRTVSGPPLSGQMRKVAS